MILRIKKTVLGHSQNKSINSRALFSLSYIQLPTVTFPNNENMRAIIVEKFNRSKYDVHVKWAGV